MKTIRQVLSHTLGVNPEDLQDSKQIPVSFALHAMQEYADQENERLTTALEEIVNPIKFMQLRLKEDERLDGNYAHQLSESSYFLKNLARKVLAAKD